MYADFCHLVSEGKNIRFTEDHARALMLQTRLRSVGLGDQSYRVSKICPICVPAVFGALDLVVEWLRHSHPSFFRVSGSVGNTHPRPHKMTYKKKILFSRSLGTWQFQNYRCRLYWFTLILNKSLPWTHA